MAYLRVPTIVDLVRELRSINPAQCPLENVGQLLCDVSFGVEAVKPYVSFREGCYTRNLVFRNDDFEVAVMRWDAGAVTPIHDHSSQRCWMMALEGSFDVENFARCVGGFTEGHARLNRLDSLSGLRRGQPDLRYGNAHDIHRVAVSPSENGVTSLHVYAKPMTSCLIFDYEGQRCSFHALTYDTVAADRIVHEITA